jgi:hypothetical protein
MRTASATHIICTLFTICALIILGILCREGLCRWTRPKVSHPCEVHVVSWEDDAEDDHQHDARCS